MSWVFLTHLLEESQNHSTFVGKLWLIVLIVFRIVLTVVGGESIYYDEQSKFVCNTQQPGCDAMCYDAFSPLSHVRFWVFQIILITTPLLIYLVYAINKITRIKEKVDSKDMRKLKKHYLLTRKQHWGCGEDDHGEDSLINEVVELVIHGAGLSKGDSGDGHTKVMPRHDGHWYVKKDGLMCIYVLQLLIRSLLEAVFLWGQYYLYGFAVPHTFLCSVNPCPHSVPCYVSRPTEKTIFLLMMYVVSLLCLVLSILEMLHLGIRTLCDIVGSCCVKLLEEEDTSTPVEMVGEDTNRCSSSCNISSSIRDDIKPFEAFTRNDDKQEPITDLANEKMTCSQNHMNIVQRERQWPTMNIDNLDRAGWEYDPRSIKNNLSQTKKKPQADTQASCERQGHSHNHDRAHQECKHQQVNRYAFSKEDADSQSSTEWV